MKYSFQKISFQTHPPILRILFEKPKYEALERFFNDDASLLEQELQELLKGDLDLPVEFAGNRTVIEFTSEYVTITDQWENEKEGYFPSLLLLEEDFWEIYRDWKHQILEG